MDPVRHCDGIHFHVSEELSRLLFEVDGISDVCILQQHVDHQNSDIFLLLGLCVCTKKAIKWVAIMPQSVKVLVYPYKR
eukprot:m.53762 g.53762  ORF g.53762 m.53762 type:complete len:79 (-) comp15458_c1_seq3:1144-1380(-)